MPAGFKQLVRSCYLQLVFTESLTRTL